MYLNVFRKLEYELKYLDIMKEKIHLVLRKNFHD
jgi:hypothetical protein